MDPKTVRALAIVAVVVIVGIAIAMSGDGGSSGTDPAPAQQNSGSAYLDSYGGSADVYSQIATSRDCDYLQDEFDTASAGNDTAEPGSAKHKWTTGYMMAADDRMREVGCY